MYMADKNIVRLKLSRWVTIGIFFLFITLFYLDHKFSEHTMYSNGIFLLFMGSGSLLFFMLWYTYKLKLHQLDTERALAETNAKRLTQTYAVLSQCNQAIVRCHNETELFNQIVQDAVIFGGMKMAWVGLADPQNNTLKPVAYAGEGTGYLQGLEISLDPTKQSGHGPSGVVYHQNIPYWCQDFNNDTKTLLWHERAKQFGWKASAALPLHRNGEVIGTFNLYSDQINAFDDMVKKLMIEMTDDIDYALINFDLDNKRKKAEIELSNSYHLLMTMVDIAPIRIFWKDKELRYLGCNTLFAKDAGENSPSDIIGKTDYQLSWKEQAEIYRSDDRHVIDTGISKLFFEEPQTTPDGRTIWLSTSKIALRDADNQIIGLLGMYEDVTERKETEQALIKEKETAQNYLDIAGVMILVLDKKKNVLMINRHGCEVVGYEADEIIGKNWIENFLPERCRDTVDDVGDSLIQTERERITYFENFILTKSGEERLIAWRNTSLRDHEGNIIGILTSGEDITKRRKDEDALKESQQRLEAIIQNEPECVKVVDSRGRLIEMNPAGLAMIEAETLEEAQQYKLIDFLIPESRPSFLDLHRRVMRGETGILEFEVIGLKGTHRWLETHATPMRNAQGEVTSLLGVTRDITERKRNQDELYKRTQAMEQSPNSIIITDFKGNIEYANAAFVKNTGFTIDEVLGQNPRFLKSGKTPPQAYDEMWSALVRNEKWQGEFINKRKDGSEYIYSINVAPVIDSNGRTTHYIAIEEDISEQKQAQERIHYLANFDVLTGLPNRMQMDDHLTYTLSLAKRNNGQFALLFLDLDHFKDINDTLGHSIGDTLLIEAAKSLKSVLRNEDSVSRMGGDEFVLLLPGLDTNGAAHVAEKLLHVLAQPFLIEGHALSVTASIGLSFYPADGKEIETLSKNADAAMYRAKQEGRNTYCFFTEEMQINSQRNLTLSNALHTALERNEFYLVYQPQLSIIDQKVIGAEALLRWKHPQLGSISPAEFIPIAEDNGLIQSIGEWVLRTAILQAKQWNRTAPIIMAVNISAVQFRNPNLPQLITKILNETGLSPEFLELELTEGVAMHDPKTAIEMMNNLHELGIRMSIDDFGTGYSSLSYLKKFNIYKLKIDQSFVRDISTDPEDKAIVGAIIQMAHSLDMQTIAEGVETIGQLEYLREQGCNEVQGYYYSKPLLPEEFEQFIANHC